MSDPVFYPRGLLDISPRVPWLPQPWHDAPVGWQLWDGQARFRRSLEQVANDVLDAAGVDLDPRAFVVALPLNPDGDVMIEPQRGHFDRAVLKQARALATRRFNKLVRDNDLDDDSDAHLAALESLTRRRAVADKLDAAARAGGRVHFVGLGVTIGEHLAFPVLALQADPWQELPQLADDAEDAFLTTHSFQEAVVTTVLDVASRELDRQIPGRVVRADTEAVLRAAADSFVSAVVARTGWVAARTEATESLRKPSTSMPIGKACTTASRWPALTRLPSRRAPQSATSPPIRLATSFCVCMPIRS